MHNPLQVDARSYDPTDHKPIEIVAGRTRLSEPTWNGLLREVLSQYLARSPSVEDRNQKINHVNTETGIKIVAGDNSGNNWVLGKDRFGAFSFQHQDAKDCWQKSITIATWLGVFGDEDFALSVIAYDGIGNRVRAQFSQERL